MLLEDRLDEARVAALEFQDSAFAELDPRRFAPAPRAAERT
jgi:hypothetical protein